MKIPFEARYIQVKWIDKNTVDTIREAKDVIEIEDFGHNNYKIEAITYSEIKEKQSGQLAFHIIDKEIKEEPYIINAKKEKVKLISVIDNKTGKKWWIEYGDLNKKFKYTDSKFCRSAGEGQIVLGNFTCIIHIGSLSFTYDELDLYLKDFRSDLWGLILKEDSYVVADVKAKKIKSLKVELIEKIDRFIEFAEKILKNPKKELTREYRLQKANQVRPVKKTFVEILTKGTTSKYLTGQGHSESFNISENKYIHALVNRLIALVKNEINILDKRSKEFENELVVINKRITNLIDSLKTDTIKIDRKIIDYEIKELTTKLNNDNLLLKEAVCKQENKRNIATPNSIEETIIIKLGDLKDRTYSQNLEFFGNVYSIKSDTWSDFWDEKYKDKIFYRSYYIFSFNKDIFTGKLNSNYEYEITGYIDKYDYNLCIDKNKKKHYIPTNKKDKIYHDKCMEYKGFQFERYFKYISNIKVINPYLNKLLEKKISLEKLGWANKLRPEERRELKEEKKSLDLLHDSLLNHNRENKNKLNILIKSLSKLRRVKKQFIKNKISSKYYFPGSMTFIQNPNYQGAHKSYKQIINQTGLDEDQFTKLEKLEKIGILDIPKVYERWCLLQIIKVLMDKFHFIPKDDQWKDILVEQIFVKDPNNIELKFKNNDSEREVLLTYEKVLENGKRPDFVLDVKGKYGENHRFIMDAKFMEEIRISDVINELYNKKNYAQNNKNSVFILHPSKHAIVQKKTPQVWAENSYYGETNMFDWDNANPNHKYGAILLSPIQKQGMYLDDLKRLIGMFFQYGMEDNKNTRNKDGKIDPFPKEKLFCIVCGGSKHTIPKPMFAGKYENGYKYRITCQDCNHMTIYSYCANCQNRLIKNGSYWTYHATEALEPVNIKCPSCGDLL